MLNTVEEGLEDIRQGKVLIVVDDEDRENEGYHKRSLASPITSSSTSCTLIPSSVNTMSTIS